VFFVLHEDYDVSAIWAIERLRDRGHCVEAVSGRELACVRRWEHRVGRQGAAFEITLEDGRALSSDNACGALNRLSFLPASWIQRTGGPDKDYAIQEMHALYLSWLSTIPGRVLNPPTPQGLAGNWRHHSAWVALAQRAGLPISGYRQCQDNDPARMWSVEGTAPWYVLAVGETIIPPPGFPAQLHEPCRSFTALAGPPLLGIGFVEAPPGQWTFHSASVLPDLLHGGEPFINALERAAGLNAS
jgi:hypothetical protein